MNISQRIISLRQSVPEPIRIIAVSKTKTAGQMLQAYNAGMRDFGENKAQELISKQPLLPGDIIWHFIGHLQTNKVKIIAPYVHLIHSLDSIGLLKEINKQAGRNNKFIDCLLQFHVASEETKFGMDMTEAAALLDYFASNNLQHARITGVMGMASFTDDTKIIRSEFRKLKSIFQTVKNDFFSGDECFKDISMGMSGDYSIAIEEGSTMLRIGTSIFGDR